MNLKEPSKDTLLEIYNKQLERKKQLEEKIDSPLGTQSSLYNELLKLDESIVKLSILIKGAEITKLDSEDLADWTEGDLIEIINKEKKRKQQQEKGKDDGSE